MRRLAAIPFHAAAFLLVALCFLAGLTAFWCGAAADWIRGT